MLEHGLAARDRGLLRRARIDRAPEKADYKNEYCAFHKSWSQTLCPSYFFWLFLLARFYILAHLCEID
jgi:hypothetical protein